MRHFLHIFFLLLSLEVFSKAPPLYFRNLGTSNGLSHNKVNCIMQDSRGFTWIGTDDGLNRYDGFRFVVYRHEPLNPSSLSGNIITDILEDKEGVLWIASADGGITRYDFRKSPEKQFIQYKHNAADSTSIPGNIINTMLEDPDGFLWLGTSGNGLLRFDKTNGIFSEPVRQRSRTILDLSIDQRGWIWAGRQGGGLIRVNPKTFALIEDERYNNVYSKLPHMTVAAIFPDSRDRIWLGSWDKVIYVTDHTNRSEVVYRHSATPNSFPGDDPLSFAEDKKRQIWIGGKYDGLYLFTPETENFYHYKNDPAKEGTIAGNRVNCIYIDHSGVVWIGTNNGLSIHDPAQQQFTQQFLPAVSSSPTVIYDILQTDNDEMLAGTNNGILSINSSGNHRKLPLQYNGEKLHATAFLDEGENMYIGTQLSLFTLNKKSGRLEKLANTEKDIVMNRIIESRIVSMIRDSLDGHPVLIALPYGHYLAYYDFVIKKWISRLDSSRQIVSRLNLKDNLIRKIYKTEDGKIWIATAKSGLGEWMKEPAPRFIYHTNYPDDKKSIGNNHVYDIKEDRKGNLWVSTYGGGLFYFNRKEKTFEHIEGSHNLAEGIRLDKKGNVWMIANGNLHRYDPWKKSYSSFELPDLEKTGGARGHIFSGRNGKLIVTGLNYFIEFHPDSVYEISNQPRVQLTDFSIFNESHNHLLYEKEIVLKYNQNFFSLEFAAPGYQSGYPVRYAHKLEGIDEDWVDDGTRNTINYTNLDGGEYEFKVRATLKPGVWGEQMTSLRIRITPPFWKTIWFYALMAAVSSFIIYGIYLYRINEIIKRQEIRNKIAQDLHDNVGSTLSSISVYSQVAKIYKQQEKVEQLQQTLEKISATSSEMISEMNDIVWAINPRNDNMDTILQRMESFARPLLMAKEIQFHFEYDPLVRFVNLDMTKRKNLYLIFKESVNNSLKYAECRNLFVNIRKYNNTLELKVKDDGKGFDISGLKSSNSLSGNGMRNMEIRANEMKGSLRVETSPGEGTTILLRFPIP